MSAILRRLMLSPVVFHHLVGRAAKNWSCKGHSDKKFRADEYSGFSGDFETWLARTAKANGEVTVPYVKYGGIGIYSLLPPVCNLLN
jgi:hypothetical protein